MCPEISPLAAWEVREKEFRRKTCAVRAKMTHIGPAGLSHATKNFNFRLVHFNLFDFQSVYPPMLSAGLPKRHHAVVYVLMKLGSKYSAAYTTTFLKPDPKEVKPERGKTDYSRQTKATCCIPKGKRNPSHYYRLQRVRGWIGELWRLLLPQRKTPTVREQWMAWQKVSRKFLFSIVRNSFSHWKFRSSHNRKFDLFPEH